MSASQSSLCSHRTFSAGQQRAPRVTDYLCRMQGKRCSGSLLTPGTGLQNFYGDGMAVEASARYGCPRI